MHVRTKCRYLYVVYTAPGMELLMENYTNHPAVQRAAAMQALGRGCSTFYELPHWMLVTAAVAAVMP